MDKKVKNKNQYMDLVNKVKQGDEAAFLLLARMCKPHIEIAAKNFLLKNEKSGISYDDLIAVGYESLYIAAIKIKRDSVAFVAYLLQTISTNMVDYIKANSYQFSASGFYGYSLNSPIDPFDEDTLELSDIIGIKDKDTKFEILSDLVKELSTPKKYTLPEKQTIVYFAFGFSPEEIAIKINRSVHSVYSYIKSAHKKLNDSPFK